MIVRVNLAAPPLPTPGGLRDASPLRKFPRRNVPRTRNRLPPRRQGLLRAHQRAVVNVKARVNVTPSWVPIAVALFSGRHVCSAPSDTLVTVAADTASVLAASVLTAAWTRHRVLR